MKDKLSSIKVKKITIKSITEGNHKVYFRFEENDYIVSIDKYTQKISCSCYNGSNFGINGKQICYHKKYILNLYKNGMER